LPIRAPLQPFLQNCVYLYVTTRNCVRNILFILLALLSPLLSAAGQSGNFIIAQNGKAVGTATVTFAATAKGYDTNSVVRVAMQGLNYNLSKTEELTSGNQLRHVQLSAVVNNSAVNLAAAADAAQFLLNVSANGRSSTSRLALHSAAVFLPDFDPGALDTLLALAVNHNNRDLWAIIPKQSGTQAGTIVPIELATYADEKGTMDGKPVTVHHLVATMGGSGMSGSGMDGSRTDIFSGAENQLMQAELPQQGFAVVRKGFVLTPPAKPGAPPTAQAAQAPAQEPVQH